MRSDRSAFGMTDLQARIGHDIGDFADLLVRKAEKANDIPRETRAAEKAAGHKS